MKKLIREVQQKNDNYSSILKKIFVYGNILDKRKKVEPKFRTDDLVGTADKRNNFSEVHKTNWSYKLKSIIQTIDDTIPNGWMKILPDSYSENFSRKPDSRLEGKKRKVMRKLMSD